MKSDLYYIAQLLKPQAPELYIHTIRDDRIFSSALFRQDIPYSEDVLYVCEGCDAVSALGGLKETINILFTHIEKTSLNTLQPLINKHNYIVVSAGLTPADISKVVHDLNLLHSKYTDIIDELLRALSKGGGLQAIVDYGYRLFDNPVTIFDLSYRLLAASSRHKTKEPYFQKTEVSGYLEKTSVALAKEDGRFDVITSSSMPHFVDSSSYPARAGIPSYSYGAWDIGIRVRGVTVAYMSVVGMQSPLPILTEQWIQTFSRLASMELEKNNFHYQSFDENEYTMIFTALLNGELIDQTLAGNRLTLCGIRPAGHFLTLVFQRAKENIHDEIPSILAASLNEALLNGIFFNYKEYILCISEISDTSYRLSGYIEETLGKLLKKNALTCGISSICSDLTEIKTYFKQACLAVSCGRNIHPGSQLYYYYDYSLYSWFRSTEKIMNLNDLCHPGIRCLRESVRDQDHEFLRTLYYYLYYMRNINQVCEELHIHRNTLFYRLSRIKELIGDDIDNGRSLQQILLSFEIIRYQDPDFFRPGSPDGS